MLYASCARTRPLALAAGSQQRLYNEVEDYEQADAQSDSAPDPSLQDLRWGECTLFILVLPDGSEQRSVEPRD